MKQKMLSYEELRKEGKEVIAHIENIETGKVWKMLAHPGAKYLYQAMFCLMAFHFMAIMAAGIVFGTLDAEVNGVSMEFGLSVVILGLALALFGEGWGLFKLVNNYHRILLDLGMDPTTREKEVLRKYIFLGKSFGKSGWRRTIYTMCQILCFWEVFQSGSIPLLLCTVALALVCRWNIGRKADVEGIIAHIETG